jgi:heme exporter protein B
MSSSSAPNTQTHSESEGHTAGGQPPVAGMFRSAWAIFQKDLQSELRTRYALNAILLFAVSTVVALSLGLGPLTPARNDDLRIIQSALLWVAILFAAFTGLSRSFVQEEEARTAAALRLAASPLAVYLGKLLFNLALLLLLDLVTALLAIPMLRLKVVDPWLFIALLVVGSMGLVAATTLIAAIISRASVKGALFAVLAFPLIVPLLVVAIRGTELAFSGTDWEHGRLPLQIMLGYTIALFVASLFLFETVWES